MDDCFPCPLGFSGGKLVESLMNQLELALVCHGDCFETCAGGDSLVSVWLLLWREEEEIKF
jgi:hypothetical protein